MASHAGTVRELATTVEERPLDDAEHAKLAKLLCHYTKQLAAHFRTIELQARPELLQVASVFSAIPGMPGHSSGATDDGGDDVVAAEREAWERAADGPTPSAVETPPPRRRGRPKGSKNRPKEEQKRRSRRK